MSIVFATGPLVSKVSRAKAIAAIEKNPDFPKGSEVTVEELDGHWVAAVHVAEGNPFGGGGPADADEGAPGPKSEGPGDKEPSEGPDDGPPAPDEGDEGDSPDGPPKPGDGDEKGEKGGEHHELGVIADGIQKILVALGIPDEGAAGESPIPGADGPPAPPGPEGPPPGAGGPPPGPGKAMKPGEAPPGGTPVGAPAFAKVLASHAIQPHPWASIMGYAATFETEERIPEDHKLADVDAELQQLARGTGYKVKQIVEARSTEGYRVAKALISSY